MGSQDRVQHKLVMKGIDGILIIQRYKIKEEVSVKKNQTNISCLCGGRGYILSTAHEGDREHTRMLLQVACPLHL